MALVFDGPVTPDALTSFVREVPSPADQVLNTILPDRVLNRNTVDLSELTRTNRTARFRAFDARLHVSARDISTMKQVKLPPLSSSVSVGEYSGTGAAAGILFGSLRIASATAKVGGALVVHAFVRSGKLPFQSGAGSLGAGGAAALPLIHFSA